MLYLISLDAYKFKLYSLFIFNLIFGKFIYVGLSDRKYCFQVSLPSMNDGIGKKYRV